MNTELSIALVDEIRNAHNEAQSAMGEAKEATLSAMGKCADVGLLLEGGKQLYRARYDQWRRLALDFMTERQHHGYTLMNKLRKSRSAIYLDPAQLKMTEFFGESTENNEQHDTTSQRADGSRAIKWLSHAEQHYRELDAKRPIETWPSYERRALADTLLPMVALYKRAGGSYLAP